MSIRHADNWLFILNQTSFLALTERHKLELLLASNSHSISVAFHSLNYEFGSERLYFLIHPMGTMPLSLASVSAAQCGERKRKFTM